MKRDMTHQDAKDRILKMFDRTIRPVLIGTVAVELRWPLRWVEELFDELVDEKKIRQCTQHESASFDVMYGFFRIK